MSVHFEFFCKDGAPPPTATQIAERIQNVLGYNAEVDVHNVSETVVVSANDGTFLLEMFKRADGNWWCQRPSESQLLLFGQIAETFGLDVRSDFGDVFRWKDGNLSTVANGKSLDSAPRLRFRGIYLFALVVLACWAYILLRRLT